jgi:hypothetical protein
MTGSRRPRRQDPDINAESKGREPIVISYSEMGSYRQCPHKHQLEYKERWQSPVRSPALAKGTLFHKVMEAHYRGLQMNPRTVPAAERLSASRGLALAQLSAFRLAGTDPEIVDLVEWMYEGYIELYADDPDWEIVEVERQYIVPLLTASGQKSRFSVKLAIDLLVRDWSTKGKLWLVDHKSGQNLPTRMEVDLSDQFGTYVWALKQTGVQVFGCQWNAARTQRNKSKPQPLDERFSRTPISKTDIELGGVARDMYASARQAYSSRSLGERHADPTTCNWKCQYLDACLLGRKTGSDRKEREFLQDTNFVQNFERH